MRYFKYFQTFLDSYICSNVDSQRLENLITFDKNTLQLCSKNVPDFCWQSPKLSYKISKYSFRMFLGCKNLLNFTWKAMKLHNQLHATVYILSIPLLNNKAIEWWYFLTPKYLIFSHIDFSFLLFTNMVHHFEIHMLLTKIYIRPCMCTRASYTKPEWKIGLLN